MEAQKRRERQQRCTHRAHTDRRKSTDSTRVFADQCDLQRHASRTGPYHPGHPSPLHVLVGKQSNLCTCDTVQERVTNLITEPE